MDKSSPRIGIRQSRQDRVTGFVIFFFIGLACLLILYPLIFVLSASISDPDKVNAGKVWLWPVDIQWSGYRRVFENQWILVGYRNSLLYMVFGTLLNVCVTYTGAYALSRKDLYGRSALTFYIVFTMWFSGGLIPTFLLVKNLGLVDNPLVMIIVGAMNAYNLIICRSFIQGSVPDELQDAARIDGCTDFGLCLKIALPLSGPVIAVLVLYYGLEHWNGYFKALLYLNKNEYQPLQIFLREILLQNQTLDMNIDTGTLQEIEMAKKSMKYALIVVASLPMLVIYPFLQRFFAQGIMIGSIKG